MAEELNTTVNDVLNLMLRRVTRLKLQIFIDFLLDMRVCDDVLGEVACSTAHPVIALYQLDVYGYVAEWVSRALIRGKVTSAMVLAEKFGLPSMVIQIGKQLFLKEEPHQWDVLFEGSSGLPFFRSCRRAAKRASRADYHYIDGKDNG